MSDENKYMVVAEFVATGNFEDAVRRNQKAVNDFSKSINDNGSKYAAYVNKTEAAAAKQAAKIDAAAKKISDAYNRAWSQAVEANKRYDRQVEASAARQKAMADKAAAAVARASNQKANDKWAMLGGDIAAARADSVRMATERRNAARQAETDERRRITGLQRTAQGLQIIGQYAGQAASSIAQMGEILVSAGIKFAAFTAAGALGGAVKGIQLNNQMEKNTLSVADTLSSHVKGATWGDSMSGSNALIKMMRKDAVALPGEMEDLVRIFQSAAQAGNGGINGKTAEGLEKSAAKVMGFAMGPGQMDNAEEIGRQYANLLSGTDSSRNLLGKKLGIDAKTINKMDPSKRSDYIDERVHAHAASAASFAETMDAQWSALIDKAKEFGRDMTEDIFGSLKGTLKELNGWFDENRDKVEYWAMDIGHIFQSVFDDIKATIKGLQPLVDFLAKKMQGFTPPKIATIAALGAGYEALPFMKAGVGAVAGMFGSTGASAGMAMGGPGGAQMGGQAGSLIGTVLGLEAAAVATGTFMGEVHALTDSTSRFHTMAVEGMMKLEAATQEFISHVQGPWNEFWDGMGVIFVGFITKMLEWANLLARAFERVHAFFADESPADPGTYHGHVKREDSRSPRILKELLASEKPQVVNHTTHINKVEITIASNQDPSRIARMARQDLLNLARNANYSRNGQIPYYSGGK